MYTFSRGLLCAAIMQINASNDSLHRPYILCIMCAVGFRVVLILMILAQSLVLEKESIKANNRWESEIYRSDFEGSA